MHVQHAYKEAHSRAKLKSTLVAGRQADTLSSCAVSALHYRAFTSCKSCNAFKKQCATHVVAWPLHEDADIKCECVHSSMQKGAVSCVHSGASAFARFICAAHLSLSATVGMLQMHGQGSNHMHSKEHKLLNKQVIQPCKTHMHCS